MIELITVILSVDGKEFFENPAYLLGVPLIAIGALGTLVALIPFELKWPQSGSPKNGQE